MAQDYKRKLIVDGLLKVENSGFSNLVFSAIVQDASLKNQDKAFVAKVFYGTIERKITLNYILQRFLSKPLKKLDKEVLAILQSGLYQVLYMNSVPAFAAINQAVELCPAFKKTSAKGLVNAVLRQSVGFDLEKEDFSDEKQRLSVLYSISPEILNVIMHDYPQQYEEILKSLFELPVLAVKVNTEKIPIKCFEKLLEDAGISFSTTPVEGCIEIHSRGAVTLLPGFEEGYFFVQGLTSQYAVKQAKIKKNDNVLDLCAAPGGKSFAAAIELANSGSVISCDPNPSRLELIEKGGARLGLSNIITLENLGEVYNERLADKDIVLCDVPCSGIGIIPKKPDLRYKIIGDLPKLYKLQLDILSTGAKYLKQNGRLVYSTCTINKKENNEVVNKFLKENTNFCLESQQCPVEGAINDDNMVTFLPSRTHCDGFFIAVLKKMW